MDLSIITLNVNCLSRPVARAGLLDMLRTHKPDIFCLQEINIGTDELNMYVNPVGYSCLSNIDHTNPNTRGTAIIWKQGLPVHQQTIVEEERLMFIMIGDQLLANLYAPSGRGRRMERRVFFGETLERVIRGSLPQLPFFLGDFNCILANIDAAHNPQQKKCECLKHVVDTYGYIDVYRASFPGVPGYTFVRNNTASRLDRIYVPHTLSQLVQDIRILPAAFSDHAAVYMKITLNIIYQPTGVRRRRTYWKLNNSILTHVDFLDNFVDLYEGLRLDMAGYADICDWWEERAKPMIVLFLKQFSIMVAREQKQTKEGLYFMLGQALSQGMEGFKLSLCLKQRISDLLLVEAEGVKVRSRFKENMEKEKASLYHVVREKKRGEQNNVERLMVGGQEVADKAVCEKEVLDFFEPLFNGRHGRPQVFQMDRAVLPEFLTDQVGRLEDVDRDHLDLPFSMDELKNCVKCLPYNRSPGLDGLTNEFYKKVFHVIADDYLSVQNSYTDRGSISPGMRRGVTRLAPKVTDTPRVDQLRPITMLEVDYAVKSRLMTARVTQHTDTIITSGQLCSRKKKNILSGVHNILSTIEYINQKGMSAALLSFDMDKAFDRCFIPYVCEVLRKMNFSEKFINIIQDMHSGISTRFILHALTDPIWLTFSIRQGDPLAMLLYIIYMEPFLLALAAVCTGVRVADFNQIDEDYCDDVEALVEDEEDIVRIERLFQRFEMVSGALLSRTNKSKVMGLGGWQGKNNWPYHWLQTVEELKIFGFQIRANYDDTLRRNWEVLVESFRGVLCSYNLRALDTIQQRTDVLKIYACSKLWYKCQVLPLPAAAAGQLDTIVYRFLWRGKLEKLALQEVCNTQEDGGLGAVDIRSKADALFIKQSCRMLAEPSSRAGKHIKYWIGLYLGRYIPELGRGAHSERVPKYYRHFRRLMEEIFMLDEVDPQRLEMIKVKEVYKQFTSTLPPPKVVYKHNLPWQKVWDRINHPVLEVKEREMMFLLVHNILPTRERLLRLNQADTDQCLDGDGVETVEHLFCTCRRSQVAWSWMRRKVLNRYPELGGLSNFELLHLLSLDTSDCPLDLIWLVTHFVTYVWERRVANPASYYIDLDKFIVFLQQKLAFNQTSQNKVSPNILQ